MRRVLAFGLVGVVLASSSGCYRSEGLMRDLVRDVNHLCAMIENKEPADKQKALVTQIKETIEKLSNLDLTEEEMAKLKRKHNPRLKWAVTRLGRAVDAAGPGGSPDLTGLLGSFGPK